MRTLLYNTLCKYSALFHKVVPFDNKQTRLRKLDLSASNAAPEETYSDTILFSHYINKLIEGFDYGIGGYNELRNIYSSSKIFDDKSEPRRLHLGIDIWAKAGTPVFTPLGGTIHSVAYNNNYGDYGATIILQHQLDGISFHTLYGHLSVKDLAGLREGVFISRGNVFAHFGEPAENGHWPPHLHFQVVEEMHENKGDYPGVCKVSERDKFLQNSPDPDAILDMMPYAIV